MPVYSNWQQRAVLETASARIGGSTPLTGTDGTLGELESRHILTVKIAGSRPACSTNASIGQLVRPSSLQEETVVDRTHLEAHAAFV